MARQSAPRAVAAIIAIVGWTIAAVATTAALIRLEEEGTLASHVVVMVAGANTVAIIATLVSATIYLIWRHKVDCASYQLGLAHRCGLADAVRKSTG
ncbi:hypothetical protein [Spongiactinospora sp. TRM90649]|uniref:hypothetical protein n=1 Tax=Spongiactinospora sp. TRM90649 TaxID=3031114 RepID=UPI0023F76905|nr:hypothetical protein [Spongiactinospora sp. TRM90649]MDF5756582.1 hypothetical protein [Spongiactinospora sp. TRM90649]